MQVPDLKVATWEMNSINVSAYQIATLTGQNTFCCHALVIGAVCLNMAGCGSRSRRLNGHIWNHVWLYMNNISKYAQIKSDGVSILLHECDEWVMVGQVDLWLNWMCTHEEVQLQVKWSEILDGMVCSCESLQGHKIGCKASLFNLVVHFPKVDRLCWNSWCSKSLILLWLVLPFQLFCYRECSNWCNCVKNGN